MNAIHFSFARCFPPFGIAGFKPRTCALSLSAGFLLILCCLASVASAAQFGDFTYTDQGTSITIDAYSTSGTGFPTAGTGVVAIPSVINGKSVTAIGDYAFQACNSLTEVTVPASVATIGGYAFSNCSLLTSVSIPSGLTEISSGMFFNCIGLASVTIPSGVINIGANAFAGCKLLTEIAIPSGVTTIGVGAFSNCGGLSSMVVPAGVTVIPGGMFTSCSGLTSVVIQGSVTAIGNNAFQYCSKLPTLVIPGSVTSIGRSAFADCKELASINIPASVSVIGTVSSPNIFVNCSALATITVDAANQNFSSAGGLLMSKAQSKLITCPGGVSGALLVPSLVTAISPSAVINCAKVTSVTFPAGLTSIGSKAFSGCSTLVSANFTGDAAPTVMSTDVFELTASNFAVYYPETATGFYSGTLLWYGYPAFSVSSGATPVESWLISKGLSANADLQSDENGDGVTLLVAYALNLDPNQNLSGSLPQPVLTANQMSMSFYSGAAGVTYVVESSSDLQTWSTSGVTVSAQDANQFRSAAVSRSGASCFMRIVVSH